MNFLMITYDFPPTIGGIQTRTKNYVKNLINMKNKVTVVNMLDPEVQKTFFSHAVEWPYIENYLGATVYRYPSAVKGLFKVFFKTIKAIKNTQIDAIHIVSGANTPLGFLFLIYGKMKGIKTGVSFYGKDILSSYHMFALFSRLSMFLADRIGVNSKATFRLLPKAVMHKATILYPGVNVQAVKQVRRTEKAEKEKRVLFVGRLVERKGADDLLQVFKLILDKVPQAKLVIVGDGIQRVPLVNLAEELEIRDKVEFTGTLVGEELYRKYEECDVFVMPSKKTGSDMEGFGMVFLEAALFKKPSVGTWSGGIPEAVLDGKTGILVPQGDRMALKNAIELLLTNEDLALKLGRNAYNRVISEFTWEKATLKFLSMYQ